MRVLAIGPHPDDVEFGAGGFLAMLPAAGVETFVATFPPADGAFDEEGTAEGRMAEAKQAAEILGATFLPLDAGDPVAALLLDVGADVVVTVDERDSHPWHRTVSRMVTEAAFAAQRPAPPQLLYMAAYTSVDFRPDVYVNVTAGFGQAVRALRCHETGLAVTPMLPYQMRLTHQLAGCRASVELAEGFRLSHEFGQDWCARRAPLYRLLGGLP